MTQEEKAKRYDEIIEKANKMHSENCEACQICIEELIPELKKSEDEMIKKVLLDFLENELEKHGNEEWDGCFHTTDMIAWLEKQGEQPKKHDVCDNCDQQGSCVSPCPMKLVEKQGEQNKVEPKFHEGERIVYECGEETAWLKSLKGRVQPQPKQEWSDVDKNILSRIIDNLMFIRDTISIDPNYAVNISDTEREITWLKSLRPQNTWKPSDEQMENLNRAFNGGTFQTSLLMELYQDLKKLRNG